MTTTTRKKKNYSVDKDIQRLGCCLPFMVIVLITGPYFFVIPSIIVPMGVSFAGFVNMLFASGIVILILVSYYKSIFTPPGSVPVGWKPDVESGLESMDDVPQVRFCQKCSVPKPERAHHCRVCDKCILKMDHHCPWINNCVGHKNHKFFLLFLIYASVGISYVLLLLVVAFIEVLKREPNPGGEEDFLAIFGFTILATVMLPVGLAIVMLLSWQLWLVATNTTSIENEEFDKLKYTSKKEGKVYKHVNKYNLGSMANLKSVFGPHVIWWWLPTECPGDGLTFKRDYRSLTGAVSKT